MLNLSQIDGTFRALAEPTRRAIVDRLSQGPTSVSELARPFDATLAAIMQHLQVLQDAGIVSSEKVGRVRTCRLASGGLEPLSAWVMARRTVVESRLDRLGAVLDEIAASEPPPHEDKS